MLDYPISAVSVRNVHFEDRFWSPRIETNRTVTIPAVFEKCESSGRVDNFRRAARTLSGSFVGNQPFDDTDVYKVIEGASYSLLDRYDRDLERRIDELIAVIAAAQEPDGYLYTNRTIDPERPHPLAGPQRWSSLVMSHELYNCGHLYQAACAHFLATGNRSLLDVALRSAALVKRVFGPAGHRDIPGHQIIEMGLACLFRITRDRSYLEAARGFLEERGRHQSRALYSYANDPGYCQDHLPVLEQREAVGHAVRAAYMYCGMADMAALWPDEAYATSITEIWRDVVESKIYLTGGIGSRHSGESFGDRFELPNERAYAETCAAIGSVMWNHRLFLLTGESRYYDVLEQTLYNGLLSGVSLDGKQFFYTNPLESDGKFEFNHGTTARRPWFDVSCCFTNLSRFFPSLPGYVYAVSADGVYVNLFVAGRAEIEAAGAQIGITQATEYPWEGGVRLTFSLPEPRSPVQFALRIRIPGWASDRIMGADLYRFESPVPHRFALRVNGSVQTVAIERGFAIVDRMWHDGDTVEIDFPMSARKVLCDPRVFENRGKAAIQRGPLVYCVEERDAKIPVDQIVLARDAVLHSRMEPDLLGGVVTVQGPGFTAVPYFAWANRGPGPMRVWLRNGGAEDR